MTRSLVAAGHCLLCGGAVVYDPDRYAWSHKEPGADHGPMPERPKPKRKVRRG